MPNAAFASGFLGSVFDTMQAERARRDQNAMFAAQYLLSTGRVKNYNDLTPLIGDLFESPLSMKGKGGKGGGKGGGIHDILAKFINPALQGQGGAAGAQGAKTLGGQAQPSFPSTGGNVEGGGQASGAGLFTEDEFQKRGEAADQRQLDRNFTDFERRERATTKGRIEVEQAKPHRTQQKWVTVNGKTVSANYDPVDHTYYDNDGNPIQGAVERPSPTTGALAERTRQVQAQFPGVSPERAQAVAAKQLQDERVEKVRMQREGLSIRQTQAKLAAMDVPTAQSVSSLVRGATIGDQATPYLDLGLVQGTKEKNAAIQIARGNGIAVVTPKEADALSSASAASNNLQGFLDQIKEALPADAAGRPLASIQNPLSAYFQTDEALASADAWDTTVIPMLRAISTSGLGRITNLEIGIAERARPKITDTVAVAAQKVAIVERILKNGMAPVLNQGLGKVARGTGDGSAATGGKGNTVRFTSNGKTYNIPKDKVDAFKKDHPQAVQQ